MNESKPSNNEMVDEVVIAVELQEGNGLETRIPYALEMEKREVINLFRRNHPMLLETQRLMGLWMEETKKVGEIETKLAEESLLTVKDLARWDTELDPEAISAYSEWMDKMNEWVREGDSDLFEKNRQALREIATADIYLSAGGVNPDYYDEAYDCLQRVTKIVGESDLTSLADEKITMITKVLNFLNKNAKKPD